MKGTIMIKYSTPPGKGSKVITDSPTAPIKHTDVVGKEADDALDPDADDANDN